MEHTIYCICVYIYTINPWWAEKIKQNFWLQFWLFGSYYPAFV